MVNWLTLLNLDHAADFVQEVLDQFVSSIYHFRGCFKLLQEEEKLG